MSDDLISRAAAIDAVNNMIRRKFGISADLGTGALLELPSATDTNVGGTNDTISRQAAVKALEETKQSDPFNRYEYQNIGIDWSIDAIKALPSAQTGRKKGKWLPDNNNYYEERFICSVCGKSYKVDTCMGKPMWDFCPCGADMRGEQDG